MCCSGSCPRCAAANEAYVQIENIRITQAAARAPESSHCEARFFGSARGCLLTFKCLLLPRRRPSNACTASLVRVKTNNALSWRLCSYVLHQWIHPPSLEIRQPLLPHVENALVVLNLVVLMLDSILPTQLHGCFPSVCTLVPAAASHRHSSTHACNDACLHADDPLHAFRIVSIEIRSTAARILPSQTYSVRHTTYSCTAGWSLFAAVGGLLWWLVLSLQR